MKNVSVQILGTDQCPIDFVVNPGVTPKDMFGIIRSSPEIVGDLNLYNSKFINLEENKALYDQVKKGEQLYIRICSN